MYMELRKKSSQYWPSLLKKKIFSKLAKPLGKCKVHKQLFSSITSGIYSKLLDRSYNILLIYYTAKKIMNTKHHLHRYCKIVILSTLAL